MKKFYNILLIILVVAAIVVTILLCVKYGRNQINERKIENVIEQLEEEIKQNNDENKEDSEAKEKISTTYNGYEIEGIIEIPKIGIKYPILEQTNDAAMKVSITKFWGPEINDIGNYTLAGHNNKDGTMFRENKIFGNRGCYKINRFNQSYNRI